MTILQVKVPALIPIQCLSYSILYPAESNLLALILKVYLPSAEGHPCQISWTSSGGITLCFLYEFSQENNKHFLLSLWQSHVFVEVTPKQLETF